MTHDQQALWHRIRDFQIDAPDAPIPFSARLAREQGWTPDYAGRVVEEYRRFAFLAVASGHGVSPSKAVDEAWHLHLLYTRNYWDEFCPKALGRSLHHNPAEGGAEDETRYAGWYEETLTSYARLFGEAPPPEIWRSTEKARPRWSIFLLLAPFLGGCSEPSNPLDWHGPAFLGLFAILYAGAFAAALLFRYLLRGRAEGPPAQDWRLHVYDQAYLNGGENLALATAIARLVASCALKVDPATKRMQALRDGGDHAIDRILLRAAANRNGTTFESTRRLVEPMMTEIQTSLMRQELWNAGSSFRAGTILPFAVACLPLLLGAAKIWVGIGRERPVGFLVIGCALALIANLFLLAPTKRTRYGDRVLSQLRGPYYNTSNRAGSDMVLGVALFGFGVLDLNGYGYLRPVVSPASSVMGSGGDGSSACGSSGCGGGGCGGGGCGGCGS